MCSCSYHCSCHPTHSPPQVYRSSDYNALIWVFQQLFETATAFKPPSSRQASAEIFLVCRQYKNPASIDKRMFDPASVFKTVANDDAKSVTVFDKAYDKHYLKNRSGYEDDVGIALRNEGTVSGFIDAAEPIPMLSEFTSLKFTGACMPYLDSKHTTPDVKEYLDDMRVLGKADFKALLKWRAKILKERDGPAQAAAKAAALALQEELAAATAAAAAKPMTDVEEEAHVQGEIEELRVKNALEKHRVGKKERRKASKQRARAALEIDNETATDIIDDEELFSLRALKTVADADAMREVALGSITAGAMETEPLLEPESDNDSERDLEEELDAA